MKANLPYAAACLTALLCLSASAARREEPTQLPVTEDRFETRNVEGWTVYINRDVPRQYPEQWARTLEHLRWELYQTKLAAPPAAVNNMQENNAIWIEYKEQVDLSYHPSRDWLTNRGYTVPRDPQSMMSLSAKTHVNDSYRHPFVVFHELALGYYDRYAAAGDSAVKGKIKVAYEAANRGGKYKSVLRFDGQRGSHPALNDEREYFAELMESYFLVNDRYPFIRCELKDQDAAGYDLIAGLWKGNPHR